MAKWRNLESWEWKHYGNERTASENKEDRNIINCDHARRNNRVMGESEDYTLVRVARKSHSYTFLDLIFFIASYIELFIPLPSLVLTYPIFLSRYRITRPTRMEYVLRVLTALTRNRYTWLASLSYFIALICPFLLT